MDASFSEFGEYEQQFYSALQAGWYQEIDFFQPIDTATRVVIQFVLQADGVIRDIEVLSSNASRIASLLCQNALSKRSPFRVWTREMVDTLGRHGKCASSLTIVNLKLLRALFRLQRAMPV